MSHPLDTLFDGGNILTLAKNDPLFHAGDTIRMLYRVTQGHVCLIRHTLAGTPAILQRARAGQVLAEASAYAGFYHCDAVAYEASGLQAIPIKIFHDRLHRNSHLSGQWAAHLARAVQLARAQAEIRGLKTVAERLGAWLGEGDSLPPKGQWSDLANELGVTREALYREISRRRRQSKQ